MKFMSFNEINYRYTLRRHWHMAINIVFNISPNKKKNCIYFYFSNKIHGHKNIKFIFELRGQY